MFRPLFLAVLAGLVAFAAAKTRLTGIRLEAEDTMDLPPLKMPDLPSSFLDVSGGSSGAATADSAATRHPRDLITSRIAAADRTGSLENVFPVATSSGDAAVVHMAQGMQHLAREINDLQVAVNAAKRARPIPNLYVHGHPELSRPYPRKGSAGAAAAAAAGTAPRSGMVSDLKSLNRGPVGRAKSPPGTIANPPTPAPGVGAGTPISFANKPSTPSAGGFKEVSAPAPVPTPTLTPSLKRGPVGRLRQESPVPRMHLPSLGPLIAGLNPGATPAGAAVDAAAAAIANGPMAHALSAPQAAALAAAAAEARAKVLVPGANRGPVGRFDPAKKAEEEAKTAEEAKAKAAATFVPPAPTAAAPSAKGGFKEVAAPAPAATPVLTPSLKRGPVGRLDPAAVEAKKAEEEKKALKEKGFDFAKKPAPAAAAAFDPTSAAAAAAAAATPASPVLTPELKRGPVGRRDPSAEAAKQAKVEEEAKAKAAAVLSPAPAAAPAAADKVLPGAEAEARAKAEAAAERARGNGKIPKKRGPVGRLRAAVAATTPSSSGTFVPTVTGAAGLKQERGQVVRLAKDMFKQWVARFKAGQVVQV